MLEQNTPALCARLEQTDDEKLYQISFVSCDAVLSEEDMVGLQQAYLDIEEQRKALTGQHHPYLEPTQKIKGDWNHISLRQVEDIYAYQITLRYVSWVVSEEELDLMVNSVIEPFLARGFMNRMLKAIEKNRPLF